MQEKLILQLTVTKASLTFENPTLIDISHISETLGVSNGFILGL